VDGAGDPGGGFGDEALEDGAGGGADVVAALGVPLDGEDEVGGCSFGGETAFYGFDDGVLGAAGADVEAVAGDGDGLVVAGVDGEAEEAVLLGGFFLDDDGAEEGVGGDGDGMGDGYAAGAVVDGEDVEVLNEGAAAPDVEGLGSEADAEEGLVEVVGVLDEEFVDVFAGVVGRGAGFDGFLTVFVGVEVGSTAGEEDGVAGIDEVCGGGGGGEEGDLDGDAAGALDGGGVGGPGALVVVGVGAGGDGDGYAGLHGCTDDTAGDLGFARIGAD
jgi:hypothetical protein